MMKTYVESKHEFRDQLRLNAELLIRDGAAPASGGGTLGVDALELLYRHASNPEHAADALKLLHELQTHQVELDLIYDQSRLNESHVAEELLYYKTLYELAPMAYLVVSENGQIEESNFAASVLLGSDPEALIQHSVFDFLDFSSRTSVRALLLNVSQSEGSKSCKGVLTVGPNKESQLSITIGSGVVPGQIMMALFPEFRALGS
jgi:PAS domain-containing protein